jgi:hypothetical protein
VSQISSLEQVRWSAARTGGIAALLTVVGSLVAYKASSALVALGAAARNGALAPKTRLIDPSGLGVAARVAVESVNYFAWVVVALGFGIVIGAMVKALVPARWLAIGASGGGAAHALWAMAGAPLMLCSCCVAPVFEGIYARTRRLGPALAVMLAAPGLNPAALAITFLVFPAKLAWGRLLVVLLLVVAGAAGMGRFSSRDAAIQGCAVDTPRVGGGALWRSFLQALREVAVRTLPAILLGVVASVLLVTALSPLEALAANAAAATAVTLATAAFGVLVALPTFAEIPLGIALLAAGAPEGAVLALLVTGPIVNLPSLLTLARATSLRVAAALGALVFVAGAAAGLLI